MGIREIPGGREQTQAVNRFAEIGRNVFKDSPLIRPDLPSSTIKVGDVALTREFIQSIAPVTLDNYRTHEHLQLTAQTAYAFADALRRENPSEFGDLNPHHLEVVGLFHDMGRLITHEYFRNELLERLIMQKIGIRADVIESNPLANTFVGQKPSDEAADVLFNSLSSQARVVILADLCSKRKPDGDILSFDEVMEYHRASRKDYEKTTGLPISWPSQKTLTPEVIELSEKVYVKLHDWMQSKGVDTEVVRQGILERERTSPVKAVIFDIGGVLVPNPDEDMITGILDQFSISRDTFNDVWPSLVQQFGTGKLSEDDFWIAFSTQIGKELPQNHRQLLTDPLHAQMNPQMEEIIRELRATYRLAALSDTIVPHAQKLKAAGLFNLFDVPVLSPDSGVRKDQSEAFKIAALKLWLPPHACLFIDDKPEYVERAQSVGMKSIVFTDPSKLRTDLAGYLG